MFGNPETTPGGRALKFYASVRLDIRRIETIKTGTESVGNRVRVKVVKNKVAPPFRVAEFDVMYGEGVSKEGGLLDVGVAMDVVTKTGAWFTFGETRLGQGREASKDFLRANTDIAAEIDAPDPRQDQRGRRCRSRASKRPSRPPCGPLGVGASGTRAVRLDGARRPCRARERRAAIDDPAVVLEAALGSSRLGRDPSPRSGGGSARPATAPELVDGAIARLAELGMLDDEAFARAWVESRDRARPRGERALAARAVAQGRRSRGPRRACSTSVATRRRRAGRDVDLEAARAAPRARAPARSSASRIRASVASAPTRCSPGTASTRTSAARRAAELAAEIDEGGE